MLILLIYAYFLLSIRFATRYTGDENIKYKIREYYVHIINGVGWYNYKIHIKLNYHSTLFYGNGEGMEK